MGVFIAFIATALEELHLSDTRLNDAGLRHLARLPHLRRLALHDTRVNYDLRVTMEAVTELQRRKSELKVDWNGPQDFVGYSRDNW